MACLEEESSPEPFDLPTLRDNDMILHEYITWHHFKYWNFLKLESILTSLIYILIESICNAYSIWNLLG